ncbi:MAG: acetyl-CoA carboxylase subunit beta [Salinicola sp.]|uniref:SPOR domain-containing protein n=1 Tax=uncultured Salinicola sp. TaxID=1193542 RepID=UPI000C933599|nr:SPOR domain-containing protein [uncultured Salinicola sp.]MAM56707.1 acetyl-CoA carboxylase subunit beta [Salinicola sp.]
MKYGWRERISGAVILVALGAIFLPMLFDDPEPRQQEPGPVMVIEQPIEGGETRQRIIESPQPPKSVATNGGTSAGSGGTDGAPVPEPDTRSQLGAGGDDSFGQNGAAGGGSSANDGDDPIADIAQSEQPQPASRQPEPEPEPEPEPAKPAASQSSSPQQASTSERTPASSDGGWVVQVGSFGQSDNATRLAAKLKEQGFAAYSQPRDNNLTTVYVGPFSSSDAGEKARSELKQAANIQGLLIRKPGS